MGNTNFDTVVAALTGNVTGNVNGAVTFTTGSVTATAGGAAISDSGLLQFVTVAATAATQIVKLPTPTPGTLVMLRGPASTGFELRSSAPSTISINGGSGSNAESAIAAASTVFMLCTSATSWDGFEIIAGTTFGAVEAAS